MKKIVKLFSLVLVVLLAFTFTGCANNKVKYETVKVEVEQYLVNSNDFLEYVVSKNVEGKYLDKDGKVVELISDAHVTKQFVGLYMHTADKKTGQLYLEGSFAPKSETEYEVIVIDIAKVDKGVFSYPNMKKDGLTFAGWYATNELKNDTRIASSEKGDLPVSEDKLADNVLHARYINIGDAGIVSLVCILIVFSMLALLCGIVALFKFIAPKEEVKPAQAKAAPAVQPVAPQRAFTIDDIKDEDMMTAALVATIDYHNETGEDVRVVSVKQIG